MKPARISLERTISLPGYENFKFRLEADLEEDDSYNEALGRLKEAVDEACINFDNEYNSSTRSILVSRNALVNEVKALTTKRDRLRTEVRGLEITVEDR